jgi:photosystem II stability/assembly factor-like uncharacterized protein
MTATYLYFGTGDGVVTVKSEDGQSWTTDQHGLKGWEVPSVAVDPNAPNRVFAGTRGDGVWVSEDFGASWKKPSYGRPGPGKVRTLSFDPKDPSVLYVGGEPIEVFATEDGAASWDRFDGVRQVPGVESVTYPVAVVEPHVRHIAIDPNDPRTMYVALQVGSILKTTDGGSSWKLIEGSHDPDVHTIVIDPTNGERMFFACGGHGARQGGHGKAIWASGNAGESWNALGTEISQEYSVPLAMDPRDPNTLYTCLAHGTPNTWARKPNGAESIFVRSRNGGESWEVLKNGYPEFGKDFSEAIEFDPENPNRIFSAERGGTVYLTEDAGDSWRQLPVMVEDEVTSLQVARA